MTTTTTTTKPKADAPEVKHGSIAAAFLAAQREMRNPTKSETAKTGSYSYRYAGLDDTIAAAKEALNTHGIALTQPMFSGGGVVGVRTVLHHPDSGESWELGELSMRDPGDPQRLGAIVTYLRRYALGALGLVAEEDTDAAHVGRVTPRPAGLKTPAQEDTEGTGARGEQPMTEAQRGKIQALAREVGYDAAALKGMMMLETGKESSKDLTTAEASALIEALIRQKSR